MRRTVHEYCEEQIFQITNKKVTTSVILSEIKADTELLKTLQEILFSNIESEHAVNNGILFRSH